MDIQFKTNITTIGMLFQEIKAVKSQDNTIQNLSTSNKAKLIMINNLEATIPNLSAKIFIITLKMKLPETIGLYWSTDSI